MKLLSNVIKALIRLIFIIIKRNEAIKKYVLTHVLKDEIVFFVEHDYYSHYLHIEKSCELAKKYFKSEGVIIDVGGADGTTAKIFSSYFPNTQIIIFEPLLENNVQLRSLCRSFSQWQIIPKAVGAKKDRKTIHKAERITSSSLFPLHSGNDNNIFNNALKEVSVEAIDVTTLDIECIAFPNVILLKLDVQGYELKVLQGAIETLRKTSLIVLEMNNHNGYVGAPKYYQIDNFLRSHNFSLFDIFPSVRINNRLMEWDCVYLRNDYL
jgi:FkbM family methyltransferase